MNNSTGQLLADEVANEMIENLYHALDTASAVVYTNWTVSGDAWFDIEVSALQNNSLRKVKVFVSPSHYRSIYIGLSKDGDVCYANRFEVNDGLVGFVLLPMIEQFLQGDRKEMKDGLSPLLKISPAII